jgi:iron complex transport system substrate-binding protein
VFWAYSVLSNYPELYEKYKNGEIKNVGSDSNPKYDVITEINPDMVFIMKWSYSDGAVAKFKELGIPYARVGEYWEKSFLARYEWDKFYASFYGNKTYSKADDFFQKTWRERNNILRKVYNINNYPKVAYFCYYYGHCYVYGAQHYLPKWIMNVKGDYVFTDLPGTNYQHIDTETFYERAMNADVCILDSMGMNYTTKEGLLKLNPDFANFKAFKNNRFYVSKPDYLKYESLDPAGVMLDYAKMIHPEAFHNGDKDLKYFVKINTQ